jgi:hypothetical protein
MRVPVVSVNGKPLMPTTPCRARKMVRDGVAKKCWNKLGVFYIQMLRPVGEVVQDMALAIDPGSKYDGYAVASETETQLCGMGVLPDKVKEKNKNRREMRRGRRYRNTRRRKKRFSNRRKKDGWIAPSQLAKVQLRLKIVKELCKIFPIKHIIVEDVRFNHYTKRWGKFFSTVEIGKTKLYSELEQLGKLFLLEGWQTKKARETYRITKCSQKDKLCKESHANDAVAMCCELYQSKVDAHCPFYVWRRFEFVRRSLHRQNFQKGGIRPSFGGTTNGTFFRKGDYVSAQQGKKTFRGWVCGLPTEKTKVVAVCNSEGKTLGQCSPSLVQLLRRSTGVSWQFLPD